MRKYQGIWERLKERNSCTVEVHRLIVARVVKAVIKEKNNDVAFKMANPLDKLYLSIRRIKLADGRNYRIEFKLKQRYGLDDVKKEINL